MQTPETTLPEIMGSLKPKPENNSENGHQDHEPEKPLRRSKKSLSRTEQLDIGIPPRYLDVRFDHLNITPDNKEFLDLTLLHCEALTKWNVPDRGIFAYGQPGSGKTTAMCCLARAAIIGRNGAGHYTERIAFVKFRDFLREMTESWKSSDDPVESLSGKHVLILDDMTIPIRNGNTESPYRWANEAVNALIDKWWDSGRGGLYITSNNSEIELADAFGTPFMDRIRGVCDAIEVTGKSYR